jgi:rhamnose utilization protein RhaD (predicted bifunctional aldolase and dehydrogenase)
MTYHKDMHRLAATYANRPDIVQGAGGNISFKTSGDTMLIKASGKEFGDIKQSGEGLVAVSYLALKKHLLEKSSQDLKETAHLGVVRDATTQALPNERASMEVWFHALLPAYVLHTHSVYINVLSCTEEGSALFADLMHKNGVSFHITPYTNPGFDLGYTLAQDFSQLQDPPSVIFLENHGVIVSGDSVEGCINLHEVVEKSIQELLGLDPADFSLGALTSEEENDFISLTLFPDQVIYPHHPAIRGAHRFIVKQAKKNGLHLRTITHENANTVVQMESEKHRKNLASTK